MYCKIVYFIEENHSLKRRANLKLRGYNRFRNDPAVSVQDILEAPPLQRILSSKIENQQLRMLFDLASSRHSVHVSSLCHPPMLQLGSRHAHTPAQLTPGAARIPGGS